LEAGHTGSIARTRVVEGRLSPGDIMFDYLTIVSNCDRFINIINMTTHISKSFFSRSTDYLVAPRFVPLDYDGMQTDDSKLKDFTDSVWELFNPNRDNRLQYIIDFWGKKGIIMDGSYKSFRQFEDWVWGEAELWRTNNPRPLCVETALGWFPSQEALNEVVGDDIVSLARDVAIYHAYCITKEANLDSKWIKWKGSKSEVMRGFPFLEITNCKELKRVQNLHPIYCLCIGLTTEFTPDVAVDPRGWTRSVKSYVERAGGIICQT
jgi:hypothetical protein